MRLSKKNLSDLSRGAAFLGTGGGGDPYIGRLMVEQAIKNGHEVEIIDPTEIPDDCLVIPTAMMGAPTVLIEKIPKGDEACVSLKKLENFLGKKAFATMPIEIGGINSTIPLVVGASLNLPVIDADGMGRAFPELQMETFGVYGVSGTPMVITNERGETALIETKNNEMMEWLARGVTIRMGGASYIAEYPMTGAEVKRTSIPNTLTLAIKLGECIREARENHLNPFQEIINFLPKTPYSFGKIIFRGKIIDIFRETQSGFAKGKAKIEGIGEWKNIMEIEIQNENLIAKVNGKIKAMVPDLICIFETETAEPLTTETLRYGQRVTVMGVSVPKIMKTKEALEVFGPQAFGIKEEFISIEDL